MDKLSKNQIPFVVNFAVFVVILFLNLNLPYHHDRWQSLGDPSDYITQSKIPLTSPEFFFTHPGERFFPRPFTVPLLYKIAEADPGRIIQLQRYLYTLSFLYLVFALMLIVSNNIVRYLLVLVLWFFSTWWNMLGWTGLLISESLSISFLIAWIASILIFLYRRNLFTFIVHILLTLLFSFTRDTWPYLLLFCYLLMLGIVYIWDKQLLWKARILLVFALIIFFVQQRSAQVGERYKLPLINSIFLRVLPSEEYGDWFKKKGMPCYDSLKVNYSGKMGAVNGYQLYADTSYREFLKWTISKGKRTYTWFLITHPTYTFFTHDSQDQKKRIWAHSLFYVGAPDGYTHAGQEVFPLINLWMILVICGLLLILSILKKDLLLVFPVLLLIVFIANIFLTYNADAMEVERHMLFNQVVLHLVGFMGTGLIIDYILSGGLKEKSASKKPD
jgi:hypothetical protein